MQSYPITMVRKARELRAAGLTRQQIADAFERAGDPVPGLDTISNWTKDPEAYERDLEAARRYKQRRRAAAPSFQLRGHTNTDIVIAFVQRLRQEGLGKEDIAKTCRVVIGGKWTRERVGIVLAEQRIPRTNRVGDLAA